MNLSQIAKAIDAISITGSTGVEISGVVCDSRQVRRGCLFVAVHGVTADGADFIEDAVNRGAAAIVSENPPAAQCSVTQLQVHDGRTALARISAEFYGNPSSGMEVIGITGTNGKTTTSFIMRDVLAAAGKQPGLIGTVHYRIGERVIPATRTTPASPDLQRMLAEMAGVGCRSAVMEVSSHALDQKRVDGIEFDAAVFTNLTRDHLDYHLGMDEYFEAKRRLFLLAGACSKETVGVVNCDDPWGCKLLEAGDTGCRLLSYGFGPDAMVRAEDVRPFAGGTEFSLHSPWGNVPMKLNLMGRFNVSNALAVIASSASMGIGIDLITEVLAECCPVPGRMERVQVNGGRNVFVDYAHTDDALANALRTLRESKPRRLIAVFGCGGNRDRSKRPAMGAIAAGLADHSILTSDNPRKEDPAQIIEEIAGGFAGASNYEVVIDREEAIRRALKIAGKGDTVLIAGKGHESFQERADRTVPFDDRQVVENAYARSRA